MVAVGPGDGGRKKNKKRNEFNLDLFSSRNELARPVMGTILLVIGVGTGGYKGHGPPYT